MIEMGVFGLLVIPLPFSVKRKMFTYVVPALPVPAWTCPELQQQKQHMAVGVMG